MPISTAEYKKSPEYKKARAGKLKKALKKRGNEILGILNPVTSKAVSAREKKMQDTHDQITGKKDID